MNKKGMIFKSFICSSIMSIVSLFLLFLIHSNFSHLFLMNRYKLSFDYFSQSVYISEDIMSEDRNTSRKIDHSVGASGSSSASSTVSNSVSNSVNKSQSSVNSGCSTSFRGGVFSEGSASNSKQNFKSSPRFNSRLSSRLSAKFNSRITKKLDQLYDNSLILNKIKSKNFNVAESYNRGHDSGQLNSADESTHSENKNMNTNNADMNVNMNANTNDNMHNSEHMNTNVSRPEKNFNKQSEKNFNKSNETRSNKRYFTTFSFTKVEYDMIGFHCYLQEYLDDVSYKVVDRGYLIENIWFSIQYLYLFLWLLFLILFAGMVAKGVIFLNFHSVYVLRLIGAEMKYTIKHLRKLFFGFFFNFCILILLLSFIMVLFFNYSTNFSDLANLTGFLNMGFLNCSSYCYTFLQMTLCFLLSALVFYSVFFAHIFVTLKRL